MKKLAVALLPVLAAFMGPAAPAATATCSPHPTCCPTTPQCWATDAVGVTGAGTIGPGLGFTPEPQTFSFNGTATVVGTEGIATVYWCSFSGSDLFGSVAAGVGTFAGGCGEWERPVDFTNCAFVRAAGVIDAVCVDGVRVADAVCAFIPTNLNPVTAYTLTCAGALFGGSPEY